MVTNPNRMSRFWQELKHRKVLRSLAIYAGTAFIILEASTIIFPLWNFPEWSINLMLWLLILGAFINVIIAWFYDITPEGMRRTKPLEEVIPEGKIPDSRGWKAATYISLVVIVALVIFNVVPKKLIKAGDIQSLLILPFDNYTGDDQLENMVSSMHALLIGDIGRIGGLRVLGETTSSLYKDVELSAPEIASEHNVDAVVEATVMCLGDSICLQIRLVSTAGDEEQLWVGDYKEDKGQMLNLYNRITKQIAEEVMIELTPQEKQRLSRSRIVEREAMDDYLMGISFLGDADLESLEKARNYLSSAIEKNPDWGTLYASMAQVWMSLVQMNYESPKIAGPKIFENLNKALELDPENAYVHFTNGMRAFLTEWDWDKAELELLKALASNPNDAMSRVIYAQLLGCLQRTDEAVKQGQLAIELDPLNPIVNALYSQVLSGTGDFDAALTYAEKVNAADPGNLLANTGIELVAYYFGDYDKVMEAAKHVLPDK
jgi:adenylate cyclase